MEMLLALTNIWEIVHHLSLRKPQVLEIEIVSDKLEKLSQVSLLDSHEKGTQTS